MTAPDMIVLDPNDNVATALRDLDGPAVVSISNPDGSRFDLEITSPIKLGHKVAIAQISQDAPAIKHGEPFGLATATISPGDHAHVHNIVSLSRVDATS
jgi:altronate hydrolase